MEGEPRGDQCRSVEWSGFVCCCEAVLKYSDNLVKLLPGTLAGI